MSHTHNRQKLLDFSDILFRHFSWLEQEMIRTGEAYDYDRGEIPIKVERLETMLKAVIARLLEIHRLFFEPAGEPEPLSEDDLAWLAELLVQTGDLAEPEPGWSPRLEAALKALLGRENLEMRYRGGPALEREVLAYLKRRYA